MLRKGVYPYEYTDDLEKFNGTKLPKKQEFYSSLNLEDITDADYMHAKQVCKDFEIKNVGEFNDLYLKSDVLLLAGNVLKIYELDPVKLISAPGLAWPAALKKTEVKLELLTDIDMLLMVEKGIPGGIFHVIYRFAKANNKYMKVYDKNKELLYLNYWDVNNLYCCAMSQKLPVNNFEWIEETSQFNEDFIKSYNEESDEENFLEVDVQYPKELYKLHLDLPFLSEGMELGKIKKRVTSLRDKYLIHIRN